MGLLAAFLEGVATFVSPCLLPLLPVYLAYFAGGVGEGSPGDVRRTVLGALGFVAGFAIPFTILGAFAGTVGSLLLRHRQALDVICGAFVGMLGLDRLGVLRLGLFERVRRPLSGSSWPGLLGTIPLGIAFAVSWSPCVGPFLAAALGLAASSGTAVRGIAMLLCYSAGLGVPFVLSAVLVDQLEGAISWVRRHHAAVDAASGALLVAVGILMATGLLGTWMRLLSP